MWSDSDVHACYHERTVLRHWETPLITPIVHPNCMWKHWNTFDPNSLGKGAMSMRRDDLPFPSNKEERVASKVCWSVPMLQLAVTLRSGRRNWTWRARYGQVFVDIWVSPKWGTPHPNLFFPFFPPLEAWKRWGVQGIPELWQRVKRSADGWQGDPGEVTWGLSGSKTCWPEDLKILEAKIGLVRIRFRGIDLSTASAAKHILKYIPK